MATITIISQVATIMKFFVKIIVILAVNNDGLNYIIISYIILYYVATYVTHYYVDLLTQ